MLRRIINNSNLKKQIRYFSNCNNNNVNNLILNELRQINSILPFILFHTTIINITVLAVATLR